MTLLRLIFGGMVCVARGHDHDETIGLKNRVALWRCKRCMRWVRP